MKTDERNRDGSVRRQRKHIAGKKVQACCAWLQFELRLNLRLSYLALQQNQVLGEACRHLLVAPRRRRRTEIRYYACATILMREWIRTLLCLSAIHLSYFSNHTDSDGDLISKRSSSRVHSKMVVYTREWWRDICGFLEVLETLGRTRNIRNGGQQT